MHLQLQSPKLEARTAGNMPSVLVLHLLILPWVPVAVMYMAGM